MEYNNFEEFKFSLNEILDLRNTDTKNINDYKTNRTYYWVGPKHTNRFFDAYYIFHVYDQKNGLLALTLEQVNTKIERATFSTLKNEYGLTQF